MFINTNFRPFIFNEQNIDFYFLFPGCCSVVVVTGSDVIVVSVVVIFEVAVVIWLVVVVVKWLVVVKISVVVDKLWSSKILFSLLILKNS